MMSGSALGSCFDRVKILLAGQNIIGDSPAYVTSCSVDVDGQLIVVDGFSIDKLVTAFVTGNKHYTCHLGLSLVTTDAPPQLDLIDYDASNVQLTLTAATGNYLTTNNGNIFNGGWTLILNGCAWASSGWNMAPGRNASMTATFMARSLTNTLKKST